MPASAELTFRQAGIADLTQVQDIGARSYLPHYPHLWKPGGVEWYLDRCFGNSTLEIELLDPNVEYYLISNRSESVGLLKLVLCKPLPDSDVENALHFEKLYFIENYTGKGCGQKFIRFAVERARELARDCVWLTAMDTSAKPIAAYERAGFRLHTSFRLDFEMMKPEFRGMVVMKQCFNQ